MSCTIAAETINKNFLEIQKRRPLLPKQSKFLTETKSSMIHFSFHYVASH